MAVVYVSHNTEWPRNNPNIIFDTIFVVLLTINLFHSGDKSIYSDF